MMRLLMGAFPKYGEGNVYRTRRDKNSPKLKRMSEVNEETLRAGKLGRPL